MSSVLGHTKISVTFAQCTVKSRFPICIDLLSLTIDLLSLTIDLLSLTAIISMQPIFVVYFTSKFESCFREAR